MGRPRLPVGSHGSVSTRRLDGGRWRARTATRDEDGVMRQVTATGSTRTGADSALRARLANRSAPTTAEVTARTSLDELWQRWHSTAERRLRPQTLQHLTWCYRRHVAPPLGALQLGELTPARVERLLDRLESQFVQIPREVRALLRQLLDIAVRHGAIATNPVPTHGASPASRPEVRALTASDVAAVRTAAQAWERSTGAAGARALCDVLEVLLGTGLRIGEVLALRWQDLDLDSPRPVLRVTGTMVEAVDGAAWRQATAKTAAGARALALPAFTVSVLARRRARLGGSDPQAPVFGTSTGTHMRPSNVRRSWRAARSGTCVEWVALHTLRKTVATTVARALHEDAAASLLGHRSANVTRRHYIQPAVQDLSACLEAEFGAEPT